MSKTSTAFFIAKRYLFSKKKHSAISIISIISMLGVVVGSMALVCVMSVFNGFQELVADLFTEFDPELRITLADGRPFSAKAPQIKALEELEDVAVVTPVVEDKALVVRGGKQTVVKVGNDIRALGVFVSTGALGLAVGLVCCSWGLLYGLLLAIVVVSIVYVRWDAQEERSQYHYQRRYLEHHW